MKTFLASMFAISVLVLSSCNTEETDYSIAKDIDLSDSKALIITPNTETVLSKLKPNDSIVKIELKNLSGESILHENIKVDYPVLINLPGGEICIQSYTSIFNEKISDAEAIILYPSKNTFSEIDNKYSIHTRFLNNEMVSFNGEIYATNNENQGSFSELIHKNNNHIDYEYNYSGTLSIVKVNVSNPDNITYTETNNALNYNYDFEVDKNGNIFIANINPIYYDYNNGGMESDQIYPAPTETTLLFWKNKNKEIYCINYIDSTYKFGQASFNGNTFEYIYSGYTLDYSNSASSLESNTEETLFKFDFENKTYFVNTTGVIFEVDYNNKTFKHITSELYSYSSDYYNAIVTACPKYIYIAIGSTLYRFDPATNQLANIYTNSAYTFNFIKADNTQNVFFGATIEGKSENIFGKISSDLKVSVLKENTGTSIPSMITY